VPSHKPAAPGKSLMTRRICGPSWAASFAIVTVGSAALLRVLSVAAQRIEVSRSIAFGRRIKCVHVVVPRTGPQLTWHGGLDYPAGSSGQHRRPRSQHFSSG
jgi:hypothetical protein